MNRTIILVVGLLLSGMLTTLSAQQTIPDSTGWATSGQDTNNPSLLTAQDCIDTYSNFTVSSTVIMMGCTTLVTENITVTNTGNLILKAPTSIMINPTFVVQSGGVLYVGAEQVQRKRISYDYDLSGNRIVRQPVE